MLVTDKQVEELGKLLGPSKTRTDIRKALVLTRGDFNAAVDYLLTRQDELETKQLQQKRNNTTPPSPDHDPNISNSSPRPAILTETQWAKLCEAGRVAVLSDSFEELLIHINAQVPEYDGLADVVSALERATGTFFSVLPQFWTSARQLYNVAHTPLVRQKTPERPQSQSVFRSTPPAVPFLPEMDDSVEFVGMDMVQHRIPGRQDKTKTQKNDSSGTMKRLPHSLWPKQIGRITANAFSTRSGHGVLQSGDAVTFKVTNAKTTSTSARTFSSAKRAKIDNGKDGFVRFCKGDNEIGRIQGEVSRSLAPLISAEWISLEGNVISCPSGRLSINASIEISLQVKLQRRCFANDNSSIRTFADTGDTETAEEVKRKSSLAKLLALFGFCDSDSVKQLQISPESKSPVAVTEPSQDPGTSGNELTENEAESFFLAKNQVQLDDVDVKSVFGGDNGPLGLSSTLREYQRQGVAWMVQRERLKSRQGRQMHPLWTEKHFADGAPLYVNTTSGAASLEFPLASAEIRGGILADEMGLGKTVEIISTILANNDKSLPRPTDKKGGTLVVCPMSLMQQWMDEVENHTKPGRLRVGSFYGSDRRRQQYGIFDDLDVVVTTYGTMAAELDVTNSPLMKKKWGRVVLDEAHNIKGRTTKAARAAFELKATLKWAVTGTPIQNRLDDIFPLLHFLQVDPWADYSFWKAKVLIPYESTKMEEKLGAQRLVQTIISPMMLRRKKTTRGEDGKPIVQLPERNVEIVNLVPGEGQKDFYDSLHRDAKRALDVYVAQNKVLSNFAHVLELLLRLRQCCDHPFLVLSAPSKDLKSMKNMNYLARRFTGDDRYIKNVLDELQSTEVQDCPLCLEVMEDAVMTTCAHSACRECLMQLFGKHEKAYCHVCRGTIDKTDVITAPRDSRFSVDVKEKWMDSAKTKRLIEDLTAIEKKRKEDPRGVGKVIVFSQWTSMLELVEEALSRNSMKFLRLDGSCSAVSRAKILEEFGHTDELSTQILLLSLKAGGVGLNLTVANHVIMLDQWWNPAVEDQGIDRVHRIGQTRPVYVKRYFIENSVEQRLLDIQEKKRSIAEGALALSAEQRKEARLADAMYLFKGFTSK